MDRISVMTWCVTVLSLAGTVLNIRKSIWCFYLWTVGNTAWLAFDLWSCLWSRATLDAVQLALAVAGIVAWRRNPP